MIQYEDKKLTRPIISSCRYDGLTDKSAAGRTHCFSILGFSQAKLYLRERDLNVILDFAGLMEELRTPDLAAKGIDHAS
jgi:hypothetical protein